MQFLKNASQPHNLFHFQNKNQYTYKVTHKLELARTMFVQAAFLKAPFAFFFTFMFELHSQ